MAGPFKDSSRMNSQVGVGVAGMTAVGAKTILSTADAAVDIAASGIADTYNTFSRDEKTAYEYSGGLIYAGAFISMIWDYLASSPPEWLLALTIICCFVGQSLVGIGSHLRDIEARVDPALARGHEGAWLGGTVVIIGLAAAVHHFSGKWGIYDRPDGSLLVFAVILAMLCIGPKYLIATSIDRRIRLDATERVERAIHKHGLSLSDLNASAEVKAEIYDARRNIIASRKDAIKANATSIWRISSAWILSIGLIAIHAWFIH